MMNEPSAITHSSRPDRLEGPYDGVPRWEAALDVLLERILALSDDIHLALIGIIERIAPSPDGDAPRMREDAASRVPASGTVPADVDLPTDGADVFTIAGNARSEVFQTLDGRDLIELGAYGNGANAANGAPDYVEIADFDIDGGGEDDFDTIRFTLDGAAVELSDREAFEDFLVFLLTDNDPETGAGAVVPEDNDLAFALGGGQFLVFDDVIDPAAVAPGERVALESNVGIDAFIELEDFIDEPLGILTADILIA